MNINPVNPIPNGGLIKFVFSSEVTLYVNECDVESGLSNALCALDSTQS